MSKFIVLLQTFAARPIHSSKKHADFLRKNYILGYSLGI